MIRFDSRTMRVRRRALGVLLSFVVAIGVMVASPFVHATSWDLVCSAQGNKLVTHDGVEHPAGDDHAAHCPLCMPVGAPPTALQWTSEPVQPLAHIQRSIPAARLASLVGAPLPARGPPTAS